jgi:transposase InsO family protein
MPSPDPPLPKHWTRSVRAALLHVIALAKYAIIFTRSWAADSSSQRVRLRAKCDQLEQEVALLREELRIKDTRMARIPAHERPHFQPTERLAILEVRAARGWSLAQTATAFQLTTQTIAAWTHRLDEDGPDALLRIPESVNKFPAFVRYIVQRLQALCPLLGKVKIAQILARAGLHLGVTTVGRLRRQPPAPAPAPAPASEPMPSARRVTAKRPNHVWHVDLTTVPTATGFWTSWLPLALPQLWPFAWWLGVVIDHHSRRALGFAVFRKPPTSEQVRQFLGRVMASVAAVPKYLVADSGVQFACAGFKQWCRRRGIRQRRGAVGQHGSIAIAERFILTLKDCCLRILSVVPLRLRAFRREVELFFAWYNDRPHMTLQGATPDEVYFGRRPACRAPRFEPRAARPRGSPCAKPQALVKGQAGVLLSVTVTFVAGRRHLPRVTLRRVA